MKRKWIFTLFFLSAVIGWSAGGCYGQDPVYRLGVPKGYTTPSYENVFNALGQKGLKVGDNLKIVPIDLNDFQTKTGRERIRRQIAQQCDLFFTTGDHLGIIIDLEIQSPLLFIAITGPQSKLPQSMQANATGVYRGSAAAIFKQSAHMLPEDQRRQLGLVYFQGSKLASLVHKYIEICEKLGIDLVVKEYDDREDIERVMRQFKAEGVGGIVLFPPAARKGELAELVKWQNRLKLPIIGQIKDQIEQGLLGGPTVDEKNNITTIANYAAKILRGRNPSQLLIKYYSSVYIVNLSTVSRLGIKIPQETIDQAEIVGLATPTKARKEKSKPLVSGNYVIGSPINITPATTLARVVRELGARGYVEGKNLRTVQVDLKESDDPRKKRQIVDRINRETDLFFTTGKNLPLLIQLQGLKTPVCFNATKETAAIIPEHLKGNFTGVVRASLGSIIEKSQRMMLGAKGMAILARSGSSLLLSMSRYRQIAGKYGVTIEFRPFSATAEIGPAMVELQRNNDFIMLFPASITLEDLAEIVLWQNLLRFPVLSQSRSYIEAGLLGGPVLDLEKVTPKLTEYMDKLLQGRNPATLPIYYYPEKYFINLRTVRILQQDIPAEITAHAEIVR
jgi:ABC-type uncharacterized transport system substrate-binding protein